MVVVAPTATEVAACVDALAGVVDRFDPYALDANALLAVVELFARAGKLALAGTLLAVPVIDELGAFRRQGHRNTEDLLASLAGSSAGAAHRAVRTGKKLADRPEVADAVRKGDLSADQANTITDADPDDQSELLDLAKRRGLKALNAEAERLAAARRSEEDAMERYRRVQRDRHLRTWTRDGAVCGSFSLTPDEGARLLSGIAAEREELFRQARRDGNQEHPDAYAIDALVNVVCGGAAKPRQPKAALLLRADAAAIIRGHLERGEKCEIDGCGSIPVTVARALLANANAYGVVTDGDDVTAITSMTRNIPTKLDRALEARTQTCEVPGCTQTKGLERDHISEFGKGGPTELCNLCRLCRGHHRMKTIFGWRITGPPGNRQWLPPLKRE